MGDHVALTVTAGPAFTAKWLAPRLFHFAQHHPEIELRFTATLRILDFNRDEVDVAIRFGLATDEGLFSVPIIHEWLTPMMTPALAAEYENPADLHRAPLLHQDDTQFLKPPIDWAAWFRAADIGTAPEHTGPTFSQADHAIDAALEGAGVGLGRISLTQKALREGRLVAPFATALTTEAHYRFVCPKGAESRPQVKAFLDWMQAETAQMSDFAVDKILVPAAAVAL